MPANLGNSSVATGLEKISFHSNFRKVSTKNVFDFKVICSREINAQTTAQLHSSHTLVNQKNISFCFTDYAKAFDCVDHNKLWKILKEMGIPDPLTCLLRNLYAGQEVTV